VGAAVLLAGVQVLTSWRGIPTAAILFIGLVATFAWVSQKTPFGPLHVRGSAGMQTARGRAGNQGAARQAARLHALSGALASIGALVAVSNLGAADTTLGGGNASARSNRRGGDRWGEALFGGRGNRLGGGYSVRS